MLPELIAMTLAASSAVPPTERAALLDVARAPVSAALGKPVLFKVRTLHRAGPWVFLIADMEERTGTPLSYAGTPRAEDAAHGMVSRIYAALLRQDGERWRVVDHAIGPTDVAWEGWAARHGAPSDLFGR